LAFRLNNYHLNSKLRIARRVIIFLPLIVAIVFSVQYTVTGELTFTEGDLAIAVILTGVIAWCYGYFGPYLFVLQHGRSFHADH
jgi:hypothetical protein